MSSAAVVERRNKQIQDAIDGGNLKQALQLCEKRLKKGENTPFLRAWKANILFNHADDTHQQRGIAETLELCNCKPAVTDIDALIILQNTLAGMDEYSDTLRSLWQNAAKARPQDEDIQLRWFTLASETGDWKTAQKAAMSLQINFPKVRKYYFWAIFMCYLVAADSHSSPADKNLFGTLAYRMISKAADTVPVDPKELLSPGRAIQTAEELFLLIKIYDQQGHYKDIVELLNSQHLGVNSRIAQNDWSFVTAKLANLEKAGLWDEGLAYASELLSLPDHLAESEKISASQEEKDDWQVWRLLLTAAEKLQTDSIFQKVEALIAGYVSKRPKSRNAQLARLDLVARMMAGKHSTTASLLATCKAYFDNNKTKLYCFHDLREYLPALDDSLRGEFYSHVCQNVNMNVAEAESSDPFRNIPVINAMKLEYCFILPLEGNKDSAAKVQDFARRCVQWFQASRRTDLEEDSPSTIETQPSDDFCLLAVMSLMRVNGGGPDPSRCPTAVLIQAAGILEHLRLKSPHNYEGLLLLVRLYLLLGAGSLALKTFTYLSAKQIQYDTVAHNLFTRISTIHPQPAPPFEGLERKDYDPQSALRQALIFYRNSVGATSYARTSGLENGSYVNVEGSIDLQRNLKHSICRIMSALEVRKIQRLVGGPSVKQYDELVFDTSPVMDKRTSDGFMNCEFPGYPSFEEFVRVGPLPKERAVKAMTVTDTLFNFLYTDSTLRERLIGQVTRVASSECELPEQELTTAEVENIRIHHLLLKLIAALAQNSKPSDPGFIASTVAQVQGWLRDKLSVISPPSPAELPGVMHLTPDTPSNLYAPSWLYLHGSITLLETLKAITLFTSIQRKSKRKSPSIPRENLEDLETLTKELGDVIKKNARSLKSQIAGAGMLGELVSTVTTGPKDALISYSTEIEQMIDTTSVELFCGSLMDSWDEALDGVNTCAA